MERFNWERKRVLITGAGGFIGSHLTEYLVELGARVRAMVHYNSLGRWGWLEESDARKDIEVFLGDIEDRDSVRRAAEGQRVILHLAALIGIPYSYEAASSYVRVNIEGTLNVLQAAKEAGVECIVHTSTSETYGTAQYVPIDEKHPAVGQSPYAATKVGADQLALSFYRSFGLPVKIARPFNTYGPRQSARAIIPTIITQILSGKRQIRLGNLSPRRDFTYVKDVVGGIARIAASKGLFGETVNIGSNTEISIGDLARLTGSLMNKEVEIMEEVARVRPKDSEVQKLQCDNSKIRHYTGWEPQYDLKSGLQETIKWIAENLNLYKAEIYNV